ncbi:transporter substrate-binding domain-containing protein [Collinsella sp. AGMB00827]|uniref:Transporter substrate-binding domain-containing protein n=1 Tax=Collinsella ureilytica TaxID=2869515 RepID=A0ABS7MK78_9ACTN|nr:transporter substrate-binding domain-containing protein [Collinsella urealyticum]MBY4797769.1 transporter substrate-binding domain-containing protein [Collinsella urealyticum]
MKLSRRQFLQVAGMGALSVAGISALTGCGGSKSDSGSKLETITSRGKLKAGVKKDVVGYGLLDTATGKYQGLEIDLCYQIAAATLGVSYEEAKEKELVEFTDVTPKTRGPLIDNDTLDIICATYTITDERKKSWDFSTPYRTDHVGVLVKKAAGMKSMGDLDGKTIGVSQGSTTKDLLMKMLADQGLDAKPEFKEFPDYPSIKSALDAGNVDAFAMDRSTLKTYTTDDCELLQPEIEFGSQDYGIATKKGSDLSKVVDETVVKLKDEGWLDEEYKVWDLL